MAVAIGDTHGALQSLYKYIESNCCDCKGHDLFLLGDSQVGFNPENEKLHVWPRLNSLLINVNSILYIVRGNHDNPEWFDGKHNFSNIIFLEDYSIVKSYDFLGEPIKILVLGGGISINRTSSQLIPGKSWFKDEGFKLNKSFLDSVRDIDIVVSHNCPDFCQPRGLNMMIESWTQADPTICHDITTERAEITSAYNIIRKHNNLRRWYYGHMHQSLQYYHDDVEFTCVNILDFKEIYK